MADVESVKKAVNRIASAVYGSKDDFDGTNAYFETDQEINATPTLTMTVQTDMGSVDIKNFELINIDYYLDPTYTQTYRLMLFEGAAEDNVNSYKNFIFDSGGTQGDGTKYRYVPGGTGPGTTSQSWKLPRIVRLTAPNTMYYMIDWASGTPTSWVKGYIQIRGKLLK